MTLRSMILFTGFSLPLKVMQNKNKFSKVRYMYIVQTCCMINIIRLYFIGVENKIMSNMLFFYTNHTNQLYTLNSIQLYKMLSRSVDHYLAELGTCQTHIVIKRPNKCHLSQYCQILYNGQKFCVKVSVSLNTLTRCCLSQS